MESSIYKTEEQNQNADFTCTRCGAQNLGIYALCQDCRNSGTALDAAQAYESADQFRKIEAAKNALTFSETGNATLFSLVAQEEKLVRLAVGNPAAFGEKQAEQLRHLRKCVAAKWDSLEARKTMAENLDRNSETSHDSARIIAGFLGLPFNPKSPVLRPADFNAHAFEAVELFHHIKERDYEPDLLLGYLMLVCRGSNDGWAATFNVAPESFADDWWEPKELACIPYSGSGDTPAQAITAALLAVIKVLEGRI